MELLPCPFCGAADKDLRVTKDEYGFFVRCLHCCVETDHHAVIKKAIAAWNSRANPASAPEGFVLVPVEPTLGMLQSAFFALEHEGIISTTWLRKTVYESMLAAAPTPPVSEDRNKLELYLELLYAVANKFPGESRHQTALRYIRNAEKGSDNATTQEDKP